MDNKTKLIQELLGDITKELNPAKPCRNHWHPGSIGTFIHKAAEREIEPKGGGKKIKESYTAKIYTVSAAMKLQDHIAKAESIRAQWPELRSLKDIIRTAAIRPTGVREALQLFQEWCVDALKPSSKLKKPPKQQPCHIQANQAYKDTLELARENSVNFKKGMKEIYNYGREHLETDYEWPQEFRTWSKYVRKYTQVKHEQKLYADAIRI